MANKEVLEILDKMYEDIKSKSPKELFYDLYRGSPTFKKDWDNFMRQKRKKKMIRRGYRKKYVYFLSTFGIDENLNLIHPRTVGIFKNFKKAEEIVKYNICDICECNYYRVALIERIELGMYPEIDLTKKWWYDIRTIKGDNDIHYYFYEKAPEDAVNMWTKEMDICYTQVGF